MILITRPQPDADRLAKELILRGYHVLIDPMLYVHHFPSPDIDFCSEHMLIFTSANGVRSFANWSKDRSFLVYTVGDATMTEALHHGFRHVFSAGGNKQDLLKKVIEEKKPDEHQLMYITGQNQWGDLAYDLSTRGYNIQRIEAYKANAAQSLSPQTIQALEAGDFSKILFFSPRTAQIFIRLIQKSNLFLKCEKVSALCLSSAVAQQIQEIPWGEIKISPHPSQSNLLESYLRGLL